MAKKGQKQKRYSAEFKLSVIMDIRENHLGYREAARKYEIGKNENGFLIIMLLDLHIADNMIKYLQVDI